MTYCEVCFDMGGPKVPPVGHAGGIGYCQYHKDEAEKWAEEVTYLPLNSVPITVGSLR